MLLAAQVYAERWSAAIAIGDAEAAPEYGDLTRSATAVLEAPGV